HYATRGPAQQDNNLSVIRRIFFGIFFFQAEDGIRDATVTGVQTCALPISDEQIAMVAQHIGGDDWLEGLSDGLSTLVGEAGRSQIGRASCRERVEIAEDAGS